MAESGETEDPSSGYAKEEYVFSEDLDTRTNRQIGDRYTQNQSPENISPQNYENQSDLRYEIPDNLESPNSSHVEQQDDNSLNTVPTESSKESEMENLQRNSGMTGMLHSEEGVDSHGEVASFREEADEFDLDNHGASHYGPQTDETYKAVPMSTGDITAHTPTNLLSSESQQPETGTNIITTADTAIVSEGATGYPLPTEEQSHVSFSEHSESVNPMEEKLTDTEVSIALPDSSSTTQELDVALESFSAEEHDKEALRIVDKNRYASETVDAAQTPDKSYVITTTLQSTKGDYMEDDQFDKTNSADHDTLVSLNTTTQETNEGQPDNEDKLQSQMLQESPKDSTPVFKFENAPGETVVKISETFTNGRNSSDFQQYEIETPFVLEQAADGSTELVSELHEVPEAPVIETQEAQTNIQKQDSIERQDTEEKTSIVMEPDSAPEGSNEINLERESELGEVAVDGLSMNPYLTSQRPEQETKLLGQQFGEMHAAPYFETGVESEEVFEDESQTQLHILPEMASTQLEQWPTEQITEGSPIRKYATECFSEDITANVLELTGEPRTEQLQESVVPEYYTQAVKMSEVTVSSSVQDSEKNLNTMDNYSAPDTENHEVIFESVTNGVQGGVSEEKYSFEQSKLETAPDQRNSEYLNEGAGVLESYENVTGAEANSEILCKSSIQLEEPSEMTASSPVQPLTDESDHLCSTSVLNNKDILSVESKIGKDQEGISDNEEFQPIEENVSGKIPFQDVCTQPPNGKETFAPAESVSDNKVVAKEFHAEATLEGITGENIPLSEKSLSDASPVVKSLPGIYDNRVSDSNSWVTRPSLFDANETNQRTLPQETALERGMEVDGNVQVEDKIIGKYTDIDDAALTAELNGYASEFGDDADKENLTKGHQSRGPDKRPLLERQQRSKTLDPRIMSDWATGYGDSKRRAATLGRSGSRKRSRLQPKPAPNDDYLFPDSVTPSKVDKNLSTRSLSEGLPEGTYDVPYIDDDAFLPRQLRDPANQNGNIDDDSEYSSDGAAWYWQPPNYYQIHLDPTHIADTNECATTPRFMHPAKSSPSNVDDRKLINAKEPKKGRKKNRLLKLCSCVSRQSES